VTASVHDAERIGGYSTKMVTRIGTRRARRVFLREWREAKDVSPEQMAGRVGIERESYYRWEREPNRLNSGKMAIAAEALEIEPEDLWRLPPKPDDPPSIDQIVRDASDEQRKLVVDLALRVVGRSN
jgi:transcriptional regulator with XRE-family HTH domain